MSYSGALNHLERLEKTLTEKLRTNTLYTAKGFKTSIPTARHWPSFAARTYIRTSGGVNRFIPFTIQRQLIWRLHTGRNLICNKSRQVGVSETVASYLSCRATTEPGFAAVVFSKTQIDSSNLARRVRFMVNSLQSDELDYETDSNTQLAWKGRGVLHFLPASARAARGIPSCSFLWLDEAAFCEGAEDIYQGAAPTLAMVPDSKVALTSTPDMELSFFGQFWHAGMPADWYDYIKKRQVDELNRLLMQSPDDWARFAIHWSQHPVYGKSTTWADEERERNRYTTNQWDTEFELKFGSTDSQIYPPSLVRRGARGRLLESGIIHRSYVLGIDPNAGGSDYWVSMILDVTEAPYKVVAMYRDNGRTTEYSLKHTVDLIESFLPERIIVEKQAMGAVVAEVLQKLVPEYMVETFSTSRPSKNTATDRVLYYLERDELIYPDGVIPTELLAFQQYESGERKARSGYNDDTVMALAFCVSCIPEAVSASNFLDAI